MSISGRVTLAQVWKQEELTPSRRPTIFSASGTTISAKTLLTSSNDALSNAALISGENCSKIFLAFLSFSSSLPAGGTWIRIELSSPAGYN